MASSDKNKTAAETAAEEKSAKDKASLISDDERKALEAKAKEATAAAMSDEEKINALRNATPEQAEEQRATAAQLVEAARAELAKRQADAKVAADNMTPEKLRTMSDADIKAYLMSLEGKPTSLSEGLATAPAEAFSYNQSNNHAMPSELEALKAAGVGTPDVNTRPLSSQDIQVRCIKGNGEVSRMGDRTYVLDPKNLKPIWMHRGHALELAQKGWVIPLTFGF